MEGHFNWKNFILLSFFIWMVQGSYSALNTGLIQQYSGIEAKWLAIWIYSLSAAFTWFIFTPLICRFILIVDRSKLGTTGIIIAHFISAIIVAIIQRLSNIFFSYNLIKITEAVDLKLLKLSNFFGLNFISHLGKGIVVYAVITVCIYGYLFYRKNLIIENEKSKMREALSKVQLENLKYQLQPHFLFNSLQAISTLMHRNLELADKALGDLGDLLRFSIYNIDRNRVTLGQELMYLQKYVDLQKTRFGEKLDIQISYDQNMIDCLVPVFILQPIVENTIKHVLENTGNNTIVKINIVKGVDHKITIDLIDDGRVVKGSHKQTKSGLGLKNISLRLEAIYGKEASMSYGQIDDVGFQTTIKIPLEC